MGLIETLRNGDRGKGPQSGGRLAWGSWTASTRTAPCSWCRLARGPPAPPGCRARPPTPSLWPACACPRQHGRCGPPAAYSR